jgi:cytochrome c6
MLVVSACGETAEPEADPRLALGRQVFTELSQPTCAVCHTLEDAGASGQIGPNLDQLKPDAQRVAAAVTNGVGVMPAQEDNLTDEQIQAVAYYVAQVTGRAD